MFVQADQCKRQFYFAPTEFDFEGGRNKTTHLEACPANPGQRGRMLKRSKVAVIAEGDCRSDS